MRYALATLTLLSLSWTTGARLMWALAALSISVSPFGASASETRSCLLEVNGKLYIFGRCNVDPEQDGSFSMGTGGPKKASPWFVYVMIEDPDKKTEARGEWSGPEKGMSHAHTPLGTLTKKGACWENNRARVCKW